MSPSTRRPELVGRACRDPVEGGSGQPLVGFCGSRVLPPATLSLVRSVVCALGAAGRGLAAGCCVGADAAVLSAALEIGAPLAVFCAFGPGGAGAGAASAVRTVARAARSGASVTWWAGGGPQVPLRGRLAQRSLALVQAVAASGAGCGLVAFVGGPPPRPFGSGAWPACGSGSWSSVAAAVRVGVPVVVFPAGEWAAPPGPPLSGGWMAVCPALPSLDDGGRWVPAGSGKIWGRGWRWESAQVQGRLW